MLNAEMVVIVITRERTTVRAVDGHSNGISEIYGRTRDGAPDYISGNFTDEPELHDGLVEAMGELQGPALAVMEQLQRQ